ncbi:hypothetical protein RSSM_01551 [Rhodopirellula sallentina SM41]|uniref:Uncharacterized protein n=1 Tax=Rhodopirellula sallentina SM41 TaxID=1263870 RepID=M5U6C7_9BACT|nr:hypothetical protein RSSM_01551 [Rhodopirellula sallentina SM41]
MGFLREKRLLEKISRSELPPNRGFSFPVKTAILPSLRPSRP